MLQLCGVGMTRSQCDQDRQVKSGHVAVGLGELKPFNLILMAQKYHHVRILHLHLCFDYMQRDVQLICYAYCISPFQRERVFACWEKDMALCHERQGKSVTETGCLSCVWEVL